MALRFLPLAGPSKATVCLCRPSARSFSLSLPQHIADSSEPPSLTFAAAMGIKPSTSTSPATRPTFIEDRWRAMPPVPSRLPSKPHSTRILAVMNQSQVTTRLKAFASIQNKEMISERHYRRSYYEKPSHLKGRLKEQGRRSLFASLVRKHVQAVRRDKALGY